MSGMYCKHVVTTFFLYRLARKHCFLYTDTELIHRITSVSYYYNFFYHSSGDTFTVCMEMVTAFFNGPIAIWAAWSFLNNCACRYVAQLILSLCQLYGDVLYFMTAYKEGFKDGPMGHPLYFWFYFVVLNAFWIIIPLILSIQSILKLTIAQASIDTCQSNIDTISKKYN